MRNCLPLFYALSFVDYSSLVRLWKSKVHVDERIAFFEDMSAMLAVGTGIEDHLTREVRKGIRPFRRRCRSQGLLKVLKVMRALHTTEFGTDQRTQAVLAKVKSVKHIKGMALLLVRQCILHGLTIDTSLGDGALGATQGLSLLFGDFQLGTADHSVLATYVKDVQAQALRIWTTFDGTDTFRECDALMRETLLNPNCLSEVDADALGCEGRRLLNLMMGLSWKFGDFRSKAVKPPSVDEWLACTAAEVVPADATMVRPELSGSSGFRWF